MPMTNEERQALSVLLADIPNPDPAQARDLAQTILLSHLDRLEDDIRKELFRLVVEAEQSRDHASRMYYPFLSPPSEPELLNSTENTDFYTPAQRQEYRVQVRDLAAFSAEHGLRESEMVKVGLGQIESHKGWIRRGGYGGPMELGQPFQRPRPAAPARSVDVPREQQTVFRWAKERIDWKPSRDK